MELVIYRDIDWSDYDEDGASIGEAGGVTLVREVAWPVVPGIGECLCFGRDESRVILKVCDVYHNIDQGDVQIQVEAITRFMDRFKERPTAEIERMLDAGFEIANDE